MSSILSKTDNYIDEKDHMPKKSDYSDFFAYMDTEI